jgi:outer membrane immunogenic protein
MTAATGAATSRKRTRMLAGIMACLAIAGARAPARAASSDEMPERIRSLEAEVATLKEKNSRIEHEYEMLRQRAARSGRRDKGFPPIAASSPLLQSSSRPYAAASVSKASPQVAPSWTGFYLGLGAGTRSAAVNSVVTSATDRFPSNTFDLLSPPFCNGSLFPGCPGGQPLDNAGYRLSAYFGINRQITTHWVAGIEGDIGIASAAAALNGMFYPGGSTSFMPATGDSSFSIKTGWDASVRGRLGFLPEPWLMVYATGGAAWLRLQQTSQCPSFCDTGLGAGNQVLPTYGPALLGDSTTRLGWTVGGGLEALLWGNWMGRAEYRYADFGTWSPTEARICLSPGTIGCGLVQETVTDSVRVRTHTVNFGLAYKFGGDEADNTSRASAADSSLAMGPSGTIVPSWSGPYLGVGLGPRAAVANVSVSSAAPAPCGPGSIFNLSCPGGSPLDNSALRMSLYAGYGAQFAAGWVAGLEFDAGWADATRTLSGVMYPGGSPIFFSADGDSSFSVRTTWDASARARLGYLVTPAILAYVTGGPSLLQVQQTSSCTANPNRTYCGAGAIQPMAITDSTIRLGWTIGVGGEAALWQNWVARGEYRYADYGSWANADARTCMTASCPAGLLATDQVHLRTQTVTFGMAYKWLGQL